MVEWLNICWCFSVSYEHSFAKHYYPHSPLPSQTRKIKSLCNV